MIEQTWYDRVCNVKVLAWCSTIASLGLLAAFLLYEYLRAAARIPKFGGPRGLPIVGNLWDIRNKDAPEVYRKWSLKHGPVYQIQLGHIPILIINTAAAAKAILIQNSHATASRPEFYTFHKIVSDTSGTTIGTAPYSDSLKRRRKTVASALNRPAIQTYIDHLDAETRTFLKEALSYGEEGRAAVDPMPLFLRMSLSLGLTLNWGTQMKSQTDLFREIIYVEDQISNFRSTTGNLQDYIPLLRWSPGRPESAKAREVRTRRDRYMQQLDDDLRDRMKTGTHAPCIRANVLQDEEARLSEKELTSVNITILAAGLDTMNSTVGWGIAMLACRPDIQEKALNAIRELYPGSDALCDPMDDQTCSYLVAMIKEILRYYTVTRLVLPRRTLKDMAYQGKLIPLGTVIFLNAWACNMDPEIWNDPDTFRPERWLENPDAPIFTFGVGSRMCIGTQMAFRELYLLFLRLLNAFEVLPVGDVNHHPVHGVRDVTALTTLPKPYKVKFVPRELDILKMALTSAETR